MMDETMRNGGVYAIFKADEIQAATKAMCKHWYIKAMGCRVPLATVRSLPVREADLGCPPAPRSPFSAGLARGVVPGDR